MIAKNLRCVDPGQDSCLARRALGATIDSESRIRLSDDTILKDVVEVAVVDREWLYVPNER